MPPASCTRSAREAASARLVPVLLLLALADPVVAQDRARLRWAPGEGGPVVGYLVHVRRAETPQYPVPLEVGTASTGPTGTREYVVEGLDPTAAYVLSVSAYGESGLPSDRSNEVMLPPRAGPCAVGVDAEREQGSTLTARLRIRRGLLTGVGTSVFAGHLEPEITGVSATLIGATGAVLNRLEVPAGRFTVRRRRGGTRWVGRHLGGGGRLVLRLRRDRLKVRVRAPMSVPLSTGDQPLTWVVHAGSTCVRHVDLQCAEGGRRVRCN